MSRRRALVCLASSKLNARARANFSEKPAQDKAQTKPTWLAAIAMAARFPLNRVERNSQLELCSNPIGALNSIELNPFQEDYR